MRPGREIDAEIAKKVFGRRVLEKAQILYESADQGDRPLRNYSREMEWASEIVKHLQMTLIPIEGGQWFAFVGPEAVHGWQSPDAVLEFLTAGKFEGCGAAVGTNLPMIICEAALKAVEKRESEKVEMSQPTAPPHLKPVPELTH